MATRRLSAMALFLLLALPGMGYALPMDGLVAQYLFSGSALDTSGFGNNGTVYGATLVPDRFGNPDSAYLFDGRYDYIAIPFSSSLAISNEITLSAWVYWNGPKNDPSVNYDAQRIISKRGSGAYTAESYAIWIDGASGNASDEKLEKTSGNTAVRFDAVLDPYHAQITFDTNLDTNRWHHIATTYDGIGTKLFIDGYLITETRYSEGGTEHFSGSILPSDYDIIIGNWYRSTSGDRYFNGMIDDVQIYTSALQESDVQELAAAHTPEPATIILFFSGLAGLVGLKRKLVKTSST